ncbi:MULTISPECIES: FtsX-like permease family protein [unclassified Streptomyces]|uniref:FtsX-like permease family protein n=1 Tax=unclassified Streptomyces TaxID=2593676 RepID=UPI000FFEB9ED|nr:MULTISPECIES: FtsX-like permease family protein [unclassified Streptomyces]
MSALITAPPHTRPPDGGLPARGAVVRWVWRMLRREWRQQLLLVCLLAFTVAAAVCGLAAAHAYPPSDAGTFGSAQQRVRLDGSSTHQIRVQIAAARAQLGTVEVISHRAVPIPGSVRALDVRAQNPHGRYSAPMLRLVAGRYPVSATEVALTRVAADLFHTRPGAYATLDGQRLHVTGLVENPHKLADLFALSAPGPQVADRPATSAVVFADATPNTFSAYRQADDSPKFILDRKGPGQPVTAAVFALASIVLLLVSLVAAAGFAVLAQRRLRQLGILASIGATPRHLRLVLLAHGALTGVLAAAAGTLAGTVAWLPLAPHLEQAAGHRIDRLALPWALLALMTLTAVAAPTAAAWWPARTVARIPATRALSARPPRPVPARQSLWAAAPLLAAGICALMAAHRTNGLLISLGITLFVLGLLLLSPLCIRTLAATATRLPFTARLALRGLGRHQARSGAALAAITLAIGIPVAVSVLAAASQVTADRGNLAAGQLLIRIGSKEPVIPRLSPAELARVRGTVGQYAAALGATMTPLEMAYAPETPQSKGGDVDAGDGQPVMELGRQAGAHTWRSLALYVATPEAAQRFGFDLAAARADTDVLTPNRNRLEFLGSVQRDLSARTQHIRGTAYTSVPNAFLTPAALHRLGWHPITVGWFIQAPHGLTTAQLTAARDLAAANGLVTEARDQQDTLATLRWTSVAGGTVLALGVLAMTVGTIRGQAADELRTLTATGATTTIRRNLTAATAGFLALGGVLLGGAGAYAILLAAYADDLGTLARAPYLPLALTVVGLPLTAAATAWLAAGREPRSMTRLLLE